LRLRIRQVQDELRLVNRLQEIPLEQSAVSEGHYDAARADPAYREAFQQYGLDVEALPVGEATERIKASAIKDQLVAGLDGWVRAKRIARLPGWEQMLAVAQGADRDPWRDRLREASLTKNMKVFVEMAGNKEVSELSPTSLILLTDALMEIGEFRQAMEILRSAQQRYPADFWINHNLASCLTELKPPKSQEAIGYYRVALALAPQSPGVHVNLGGALLMHGELSSAWAAVTRAIEIKPDYAEAHNLMGRIFFEQRKFCEAKTAFHEAIRLKPKYAEAYTRLGTIYFEEQEFRQAEAAFHEAVSFMPELKAGPARCNLANALFSQGKVAEAMAEFRKGLELKPDYALGHKNFAWVLQKQNQLPEAEAEYGKAIASKPDYAEAHYNLAMLLGDQGKFAESEDAFGQAIRHKPDYAEAHCNRGFLLMKQGKFTAALTDYRRGHEIGSQRPGWNFPSEWWLRDCERHIALDAKLTAVLGGQMPPGECVELASLCQQPYKQLHVTAVRLFRDAFAADSKLTDPRTGNRYNAACSAALAGCGVGRDAEKPDDAERALLRSQALGWLRAELAAWGKVLGEDDAKGRQLARQQLAHWLEDADLAGVRGEALAKLPEPERQPWQGLWADLDKTLATARERATRERKDDKKD
jgi:tetratricopeptide (TPR) repeat protein